MAIVSTERWNSLEEWRSTAFLVAGVIFLADTAIVASHVASGTEPGAFGQTFVGAAWTASFIGVLGMFPSLADRNRWLARIGVVCAAIGGITMAVMAVTFFGYFTGILNGDPSAVAMFFLPGVFVGIVLGFGSFGVATLRSDIYSPRVGLLFLVLVATFLFNIGSSIAGFASLTSVLGVVAVLSLTKLTIGYLFRTGSARAPQADVEASSGPTA